MKAPLKKAFRALPPSAQALTKNAYRKVGTPVARTRMGAGVEPLSYAWGADRGKEIARYYIEQHFLVEFRGDVRGRVLEFFDIDYTAKYSDGRVTQTDVINLEEGHPSTTIRADLTDPNNGIPADTFDCIICTHVLHVIYDFQKALAEMHRILKPGGVLLIAVPHVSMCDPGWGELWRFTEEGLRRALVTSFASDKVTMRAYGNSLTAAGEIRGLVAQEFTRKELTTHDTRFAVDICARAVK